MDRGNMALARLIDKHTHSFGSGDALVTPPQQITFADA
jgi:hypothetical protein